MPHDLPPYVKGAVEALGKEFKQLCSYAFRSGDDTEDNQSYADAFSDWLDSHPAISRRYSHLITQNTPATTFWADFELSLEMVAALGIERDADQKRWIETEDSGFEIKVPGGPTVFARLVEIGLRHQTDGVALAKAQMESMMNDCHSVVRNSASWTCDRQLMNASWRAPRFLLVGLNDPDRAMERLDATDTRKALESLVAKFDHELKKRLEVAGDRAYLAAAERPSTKKAIEGEPHPALKAPPPKQKREHPSSAESAALRRRIMKADPDEWISRQEAADAGGVSLSRIRQLIEDGTLRKSGQGMLVTGSVQDWLKAKTSQN